MCRWVLWKNAAMVISMESKINFCRFYVFFLMFGRNAVVSLWWNYVKIPRKKKQEESNVFHMVEFEEIY